MNIPLDRYKTLLKPEALAQKIAQQSIALISNKKHLLPIDSKKVKDLLLLIPDLSVLPILEEGYKPTEKHFLIKECKRYFSGTLAFHFFPLSLGHREIEEISNLKTNTLSASHSSPMLKRTKDKDSL